MGEQTYLEKSLEEILQRIGMPLDEGMTGEQLDIKAEFQETGEGSENKTSNYEKVLNPFFRGDPEELVYKGNQPKMQRRSETYKGLGVQYELRKDGEMIDIYFKEPSFDGVDETYTSMDNRVISYVGDDKGVEIFKYGTYEQHGAESLRQPLEKIESLKGKPHSEETTRTLMFYIEDLKHTLD